MAGQHVYVYQTYLSSYAAHERAWDAVEAHSPQANATKILSRWFHINAVHTKLKIRSRLLSSLV